MKLTEQIASPASASKTGGLFASLRVLLDVQGLSAPLRRYALLPALALAVLAFTATLASAAKTRPLEASFGPDGTAGTAFERPAAVGVDQSTGSIYVGDEAVGTVQKFNSAHEPEPFTGIAPNIVGGKLTGFSFFRGQPLNQIAVSSASHDIYVLAFLNNAVRAYQSEGVPADFTAGPSKGTNELGGIEPCGVAVDPNGDIYVSFFDGVHVYASSGEPLTKFRTSGFPCNLSVDSHGTVYANKYGGGVEKFIPSEFPVAPSTMYTSGGIVDGNASYGVAVDPTTDHVFVDERNRVAEYSEGATEELLAFGASGPGAITASEGLAVNGVSGHVYVSDAEGERRVGDFGPVVVVPGAKTGEATEIKGTSATLKGSVNPEGVEVTDCHFDYGVSTAYGQTAACEQTVGKGSGEVAVTARIKGLTPGTTYHLHLQASNKNGASPPANDAMFSTPPPPAITGASVTNLTATSADLNVKVDPHGVSTICQFEYGTDTGYGQTRSCSPQPGSASSEVQVSQYIEGLTANMTYHWRVVASSEAGTTTGSDHTFIYQIAGDEVLPDNRAYEMVTPPQKNGGLIGVIATPPPLDISDNGLRLILMDIQCFASSESCNAFRGNAINGEPFEFARTTTGTTAEWKTTALAPPSARFSENTPWKTDANEGVALFSMPVGPAGEDEWYARQPSGSFLPIGPTTPPGFADGTFPYDLRHKVSTADLSHVVWENEPEGGLAFWPFDKTRHEYGYSTYEYVSAHNPEPFLVGISNEGPPKKNTESDLISTCGTAVAEERSSFTWSALSANGRTVYFTAEGHDNEGGCPSSAKAPPVSELYARVDGELPDAHTVAISQPQALNPAAVNRSCETTKCKENTENPVPAVNQNWRDAQFAGASTDGSKAFFLDTQQLTDKATQGTGSASACEEGSDCNLYLYDFAQPEGQRLIDVSAPETSGESPLVQGVVASSADGSHVYFVANGVLASGASTGDCRPSGGSDVLGTCNLYVYERDARYPEGRTTFIASLPGSDRRNWEFRRANVTPDGRFLVFASHGALTPDAVGSDGADQVFRYDAASGQLVRISIGNEGFNDNGNAGTGDASIVPAWLSSERAGPPRGDPTMSNDGSYVFFQSPVALTPHALNDVLTAGHRSHPEYAQNVYEWHEGHVYLISDGRDVSSTSTPCRGAFSGWVEEFRGCVCSVPMRRAPTCSSRPPISSSPRIRIPRSTSTTRASANRPAGTRALRPRRRSCRRAAAKRATGSPRRPRLFSPRGPRPSTAKAISRLPHRQRRSRRRPLDAGVASSASTIGV